MKFSRTVALLSLLTPLLAVAAPTTREAALLARQGQADSEEEIEAAAEQEAIIEEAEEEEEEAAAAGAAEDPETSLTIDLSVLAAGFVDDGVGGFNGFNADTGELNPPFVGVPSLISVNNFINFCIGETITDGKQIEGGSCNPCPIGQIPNVQTMPSSKFIFPPNFDDSLTADTPFTIELQTINMEVGVQTNAQTNFMAAPQQLNDDGQIIGRTAIIIEELDGLDQTDALNPQEFVLFQGINTPANANGFQEAEVAGGLPAGDYRLCTYTVSANGVPAIVPVAQHGCLDDCVYFTVNA